MRVQKIKRRNRTNLILELTPLIDVVFLLLIFFMVATTFEDVSSGIKIELPESTIQEVSEVKEIQVVIDADSRIYLSVKEGNGSSEKSQVNIEQLKEELAGKILNSKERNVIITADKNLDYGFIVKVMTLAKEAGASSLDIDTASAD